MNSLMRGIGKGFKFDIIPLLVSHILNHQILFFVVSILRLIPRLTQLTLQILPVITHNMFTKLRMNLTLQPFSQTANMDKSHTSSTFAGGDERVCFLDFFVKANTTNWFIGARRFGVLERGVEGVACFFYQRRFFDFGSVFCDIVYDILIWVISVHFEYFLSFFEQILRSAYPCYQKPNSSKLDNIPIFNLIPKFLCSLWKYLRIDVLDQQPILKKWRLNRL
jgi:hypothetical protein